MHRRTHAQSWDHRRVLALGFAVVVLLAVATADLLVGNGFRSSSPDAGMARVHVAGVSTGTTGGPAPKHPAPAPGARASVISAEAALAATPVPRTTVHDSPIALLQSAAAIPASLIAQISAIKGAAAGALGSGTVTVGALRLTVLSGDPAWLRQVVPTPSANSDALWASLARGDAVETYEGKAATVGTLGGVLTVTRPATGPAGPATPGGLVGVRLRLGARAGFGLSGADIVVSTDRGTQIGLAPQTSLLVAAAPGVNPAIVAQQLTPLAAAAKMSVTLLGQAAAGTTLAGGGTWLNLYQQAATTCPGLPWQVLAAIGQVESDHGRNDGPSSAGAIGPMQFLPATFAALAVDGDHDGKTSPWDAYDAVYTAAKLLCLDGGGRAAGLYGAIFSYNHADWYVAEVLALSQRY